MQAASPSPTRDSGGSSKSRHGTSELAPIVADPDLVERARLELGADMASAFATRLVVQTPGIYERFTMLVPGFSGHDAAFLGQLRHTVSFDVDRLPAPFPGPALFVLGRQDTIVGYRGPLGLIDQYPRATMAVLDRAGHALPWEQHVVFHSLLDHWLARIEESGTTSALRHRA
jgi:pimeloyl-ACP methyl ester carboxylesterase